MVELGGLLPVDVTEDKVLPRLTGRALGRLLSTCRGFRELIHDDHPAWWSAHQQVLTGKPRLMPQLAVRKRTGDPGSLCRPAGEEARSVFLDVLADSCCLCGAVGGDMELRLSATKRSVCGSCIFSHPHHVASLRDLNTAASMRARGWEVRRRREGLEPLAAAVAEHLRVS
eukprot:CAMPEP_0174923980 /NCGR_PEP_ID=MMETSP1355-20121228/6945_1 /TAXON_ID=464990 /ORGANISM="Hemiselmis tepida, Strain CCMP443" /LENGTH=170 /DNA_ID=CAMNT_0016169721 /DNA_START=127 /DNA_END=635 /DNA_ORIENTATION=-